VPRCDSEAPTRHRWLANYFFVIIHKFFDLTAAKEFNLRDNTAAPHRANESPGLNDGTNGLNLKLL